MQRSRPIWDFHNVSDIEPSIQPDFSMATTVEAHPPPRMDDFPSPTDEGLSSPESEDYPHKPQSQDYIYNDSGILMDESTMNSTTQSADTNGQIDDNLSDTSSMSDPSDYHISRYHDDSQYSAPENTENDLTTPTTTCTTDQDTRVGEISQEDICANGEIAAEEVEEAAIEAEESHRENRIPIDKLPPPPDGEDDDTSQQQPTAGDKDTEQMEFFRDSQGTLNTEDSSLPTITLQRSESESEGEEIREEVILRSDAKREEYKARLLAEEREREKVDFVPGMMCDDVDTALRILKTRYRLSCSTLKKCIITLPPVDARTKRYSAPIFSYDRSRWNLEDMIRTPNEQMPWWSQTREPESVCVEKDDIGTMNATIDRRQGEIANLLEKVLDDDRKKRGEDIPLAEPEIVASQNEPGLEQLPDNTADADADANAEPTKKKKGNVFQRMIRALRKRLSRNRHRA